MSDDKFVIQNWQAICAKPVTWAEAKDYINQATVYSWDGSQVSYGDLFENAIKAEPEPANVEIAEVLERAADLFESGKLEWIQGQEVKTRRVETYSSTSEVYAACAIGALGEVRDLDQPRLPIRWTNPRLHQAVLVALMRHLGGPTIPIWNDILGRTVGEVIDLFKTVAKNLRNEDGK